MISYKNKVFQDNINNDFLIDLVYFLKLSPEKANEHFDTCMSISYKKYRHYPNYWACRKGLNLIAKTNAWGYLE